MILLQYIDCYIYTIVLEKGHIGVHTSRDRSSWQDCWKLNLATERATSWPIMNLRIQLLGNSWSTFCGVAMLDFLKQSLIFFFIFKFFVGHDPIWTILTCCEEDWFPPSAPLDKHTSEFFRSNVIKNSFCRA
jgi:hypothetical protein